MKSSEYPTGALAGNSTIRNRVFYTLLLIAIYRLGVFIPTPGIDLRLISNYFQSKGFFFQVFNLFSGGALEKFSVCALGIMPYISASIIVQLLTVVVPRLESISKEGGQGRKKLSNLTRFLSVFLAFVQGNWMFFDLYSSGAVLSNSWFILNYLTVVLSLVVGTVLILWLSEQITDRGIGNGVSLVIFSGIVARMPSVLRDVLKNTERFDPITSFFILALFIFFVVSYVIFFERSHRKIPIQHARKVVGRRVMGADSVQYLPIKLNNSGVIPPIFASSLLLLPVTFTQFFHSPALSTLSTLFSGGMFHYFLYLVLIVFFAFFYTSVAFNSQDLADNLKKGGAYVPGIRPGASTKDFIDSALSRLTVIGALYLATVCILPEVIIYKVGISRSVVYIFGGTSLLIVVGVAIDTFSQIESAMVNVRYSGLLKQKNPRFKGRKA